MIKILFICHGNICRSPMAEFIMKDIVAREQKEELIYIESAATSREALGCDVHKGIRKIFEKHKIPWEHRQARQVTEQDFSNFDYLIVMDKDNLYSMEHRFGHNKEWRGKTFKLLQFCGSARDVADPWYTGDFKATYNDISSGCQALYSYLMKEEFSNKED